MAVQKMRIDGVQYVGRTTSDGATKWEPPLPPSVVERDRQRFEDVLASRAFPGLNTDTTFLAGRGTLEQQFGGDQMSLDAVIAGAKKHGYTPSPQSVYSSAVARFPGDPEAFIPASDGKGHIRKICEKRNIGCSGSVNIPTPEPREDPAVAVQKSKQRALAKAMVK